MTVRIAVAGAGGRMGRMIVKAVCGAGGAVLSGALVSPGSALVGQDAGCLIEGGAALEVAVTADRDEALCRSDVLIDFTTPGGTAALAAAAAERGVALVIGTTGLYGAALAAVAAAAGRVPVVRSANMSLGVNVLLGLLPRVSLALGEYDVEIVELHHRLKQDAPSGTALMMEQAVAEARGLDAEAARRSGREGVGQRTDGEIGVMALRGGDVVGEHTAYFFGPGERVEISHRATDRGIFARGAVRAALWVSGRTPGGYDMQDVLGLRS